MKTLLLTVCAFLLTLTVNSQGLENVIVEKYYISDANDATVNSTGGVLPVGSVTYRVYLDLLPDYIFQAAYGDGNHECRIETTTLFFNNEDRGATTPTFSKNFCDDNTVMLDSWLSVGAACAANYGVRKIYDDGVATVVNNDGVLTNNDPMIGIPLTVQDGFLAGTPQPVTEVGITTEIAVFDAQNDGTNGPVFSTNNGSWASLNGSSGPDPLLNEVLIAQITTDGIFSFQLNVQIRNNITNVVENYVASNPVGSEVLFPALNYNSSTGISDASEETFSIGLYPNPVTDVLYVRFNSLRSNGTATFKLIDILGNVLSSREVKTSQGLSSEKFDLSHLSNGIYFLEVDQDGVRKTKKVVKH